MGRIREAVILGVLFAIGMPLFAGEDQVIAWPAVTHADLSMNDFAPFPGSHAVLLLRKNVRDDRQGWEMRFYRYKVLDEQGKSVGDLETESYYENTKFTNVEARVIRPDGTVAPYTGTVSDRLVMQFKDVRETAKRISLPDVQVGSIIDFRYTIRWDSNWNFSSAWVMEDAYPTRDAEFSLRYKKASFLNFTWTYRFLPPELKPVDDDGTVKLTLHHVPAANSEPYMPPSAEVRPRVDFEYRSRFLASIPEEFWNQQSKFFWESFQAYTQNKKAMQKYAEMWTNPTDSQEIKARKLYEQVQKLRNLTYERTLTWKEIERQKLKENIGVDDVLKHGYGFHNQLVRTYVALANAAGLEATAMRVVERDTKFHHPEVLDGTPYSTELAVVKIDGVERYLDPGVPFCPFGLVPWEDTDTFGMRLNKEKVQWEKTPEPLPAESVRYRRADLELNRDGSVSGTVKVEFQGRFAMSERLARAFFDDEEKKKSVENMFKEWLPNGAKIEVTSVDDWKSATDKFMVTAKISIGDYATTTGKRMMLPISPFTDSDQHGMQASKRTFPVYLRQGYKATDEVAVKIPDGMEVETVPKARSIPTEFADLFMTVRRESNMLTLNRQVTIGKYYYPVEAYPMLREFLERVRLAGEEQAVLRAAGK